MDDRDLTQRAFRAYFRSCGQYADQPSNFSGVETADNGRHYVVLRGGRSDDGICAVYRILNDETLKRLKRFPSGLDWTRRAQH